MAFGEKFNFNYVDLLRNNSWEIAIFEDGFVGSITSIVGSGEPLIINWLESKLFEPIGASQCILELESNTNFQFGEFLNALPNQFLITVKKNTLLYWQGVNVTENSNEPYDDVPYSTSIQFTDGLGQLKFTEFEDSGLIDGQATIIDIITFCLNKLPYQLDLVELINVLEDNYVTPPVTFGFLNTTFLDRQVFRNLNSSTQSFEGWNCLAVLREILHAIGATIYQANNTWRIVRIEEYENAAIPFIRYQAGTSIIDSTGIDNVRVTIDNDAINGLSWINRNADLNVSQVFDEIEYIYKFGSPDQDPGELIADSDFSISVNSIPDLEGFDLFEIGPGYSPGFTPIKFSVPAQDFYYNVPTTGIYYDTPSMQINPVFDSTKFLKPLEYAAANNTRQNLITTINDNAVITFDGFLEMELGAYSIGLSPTPPFPFDDIFTDQFVQLNLPYEITFFVSVQIGTFYLEEDSEGVLSWGIDASSIISIRKIFDLKKPLYSWRGGIFPSEPQTKSLTNVFKYGPIVIELPNWPSNDLSPLNVKLFQPATPIIFADLNNVQSAIQAITLQVTPFSFKYQPSNNKLLSEVLASRFSTLVKDRKMTVTVLFGDGPHAVIKNSFLVAAGLFLESSDNWIKASGTIDTFLVDSITNDGAGKPTYTGLTDHNFVVGQFLQGEDFNESNYNVFQKITQVLSTKIFITNAVFSEDDTGTLFERNSAAETFILGPYGKYFSKYRDDLRGDLTGDFDFSNSIVADNGKLYFQRGASYKTKSNEVTVQLFELNDDPLVDTDTNQFTGTKPSIGAPGPNTDTNTPNTDAESVTNNTGHQVVTNTQNMNIQIKSSQIIKINGLKHNPDTFRNYPSS